MEESTLLELRGCVEHVVYHNDRNQYTVMEIDAGEESIVVVGLFPYVSEGEELRIYGKWTTHSSFGQQFKAEAFEHVRPSTTSAMLKYLSSGAVKGIGKALAGRIIEAFGDQTMEVLENDPVRLSQIKGITRSKAVQIGEDIQRIYGIRELMIYLAQFGVAPENAVAVWKRYGSASISCLQEDPYSICDEELGISFEIADAIGASMEKAPDNRERVKAGVKYVLRHNLGNGHTCLPKAKVAPAAAKMLGVTAEDVEDAIYTMRETFALYQADLDQTPFLFLPKCYQSEQYIAQRMKLMKQYPPQRIGNVAEKVTAIEAEKGLTYAQNQREAIYAALEQGILILTGGPGTGKTTTLNAIIQLLKQHGESVLLAAPTGRAAKRMSELTGEEAKTLHRMLMVEWDEQDQAVFKKNERDPLDCDCIVIDELSMVDSQLFESVLRALPLSCRMIFVGDSDQLPSVGAGNVLGDLIAAGQFKTVQLNEIFRQSMQSLIVSNAHQIISGQEPELNRRDSDFFFLPAGDMETAADTTVALCASRLPKSYGYSSVADIQVLCPSRKGELGTVELNKRLRAVINPPQKGKAEAKIGGTIFRTGDKVMHTKNNYNLAWERPDGTHGEGVFNGDMGIVAEVDRPGGVLRVRMDDKIVTYGFDHAQAELEHAYAVTIHKSQGNEFPAVVIPVLNTVPLLCYRNLFYTAITRAKELLILVGSRQTIHKMVENDRKTKRYTGLKQFLQEEGALPEHT